MENELSIIKKLYNDNKLSHAYIIETDNMDFLMCDLYEILSYIYSDLNKEGVLKNEYIKEFIIQRAFPNIYEIEPEGTKIKKEQIKELVNNMSLKSPLINFKTYIIKYAEKLNKDSSNVLLKFLEEPFEDTLGFLITDDKSNLIDTITSRCQVIKVYYGNQDINETDYDENIRIFVDNLKNKNFDLLEMRKLINVKNRNEMLIYINKLLKIIDEYFPLNDISNKYTLYIHMKYKIMLENIKIKLNSNCNIELLIDEILISTEEIVNENI